MQATRAQILQIIQARQSETVAGLARELGLASATVRRHLDILQRDGFLGYEEVRHGTGRPEHFYSLTDLGHEELPKEYDALLSDLVGELSSLSPSETRGRSGEDVLRYALTNIAERAAEPYTDHNGRDPVDSLTQLLTDRGFSPEVEVTDEGVRITLNNCPFRVAAIENPVICSFDTGLISGVMGAAASRRSCIRLGDQCCIYTVALDRQPVSEPV